ncbi:MAG: hypothetical protein J7J14_05660 [Thermotogaceae bacterium]|nr:hypothetical protein [Thermotogaceae bacterium]
MKRVRSSEFLPHHGFALQYITLLSDFINLLKKLLKKKYFRLIRGSLNAYDKALSILKKINKVEESLHEKFEILMTECEVLSIAEAIFSAALSPLFCLFNGTHHLVHRIP